MTPMHEIDVTADVLIPYQAELRIRTATEADAKYVIDRSHRWRKRVGWLPASALEAAISRRWIWIAEIDNQPAGHTLISGGRRVPYVLRHNCVEKDLWGRGIGTVYTSVYVAYAKVTGKHTTAQVRTRHDIIEQTIINAKTGGRPIQVDQPNKTARGNAVVTWSWYLRQRPRVSPPVGVEQLIDASLISPHVGDCIALPDGGAGCNPARCEPHVAAM
jgi:hypothetical protein